MIKGESSAVLRHVRTLFGAGAAGGASDGQLMERFRERGDRQDGEAEAAFAVLVARHGPMVLGVCRRALRDPDAAADAFQATFLVLVRKAHSLRIEDSLGRWLYGVSRKVAARARAQAARRTAREGSGPGPEVAGSESSDDADRRELLAALDEEIAWLPEPFRAAVVLCDLGGLTHEAAARQLGCPVGTVESRLSRGRKRLRDRLARRGLAPSLALTVAGTAWPAPVALPEALSVATVAAAMRAGSASAAVSTLIAGVITDMTRTKIKAMALGLAAATLACGLAIVTAHRLPAEDEPARSATRPAAAPFPIQPAATANPGDQLVIEVLEALPGRPISGSRLVRPDGTISLGFYGDLDVAGLTRQQIKVKLIEHLSKYLSDEVLGLVEQDKDGKLVKVAPADLNRVFVDDSLIYERGPHAPVARLEAPAPIKPGDRLLIEVLEALPGRPISGERYVRPDGTISLGFYGDLDVAGLTRRQIKAKVVEHLRKYLNDEVLGLIEQNEDGKFVNVAPADSNRVFVDDSVNLARGAGPRRRDWGPKRELGGTAEKLDRILEAIEAGQLPNPYGRRPDPEPATEMTQVQRLGDHDRRLEAIEAKLDRLIRVIEGPKGEEKR